MYTLNTRVVEKYLTVFKNQDTTQFIYIYIVTYCNLNRTTRFNYYYNYNYIKVCGLPCSYHSIK